jgi:hypothetical protein
MEAPSTGAALPGKVLSFYIMSLVPKEITGHIPASQRVYKVSD